MKKVTTIDFSDLFHWVAKYGISWNQANDIFFREEVLTYKSYNEWFKGKAAEDVSSLYEAGKEAWELTEEEVKQYKDGELASILIDIFLHEHNVDEAVFLND